MITRTWYMKFFVTGVYAFLYIPLLILMLFSFNAGMYVTDWAGFSLHWYQVVFASLETYTALTNSLFVACCAVLLSVCMGALYVFYAPLCGLRSLAGIFYISLAIPEIILAASLLGMFSMLCVPLGLLTLIIGHTILGLGYVIPVLSARFEELDSTLLEASYDLGATKWQTFIYVALPFLAPSLIASALLVFIISLDDFILSFLCTGASTQTLPVYLFSLIRAGANSMVNVISTLMVLASTCIVALFSWVESRRRHV